MIISTGDLKQNYEIIDVVFAMDSHKGGLFSSVDPNKAFEGVKGALASKCQAANGDAVLNCQFEYRVAMDGKKQVLEIFAYGTIVKLA